jgi:hypothetical protein
VEDVERAKKNFSTAVELGGVYAMVGFGRLLDKDDPQGFVLFVWDAREEAACLERK